MGEDEKTHLVADRLGGEAQKWYMLYSNSYLDYQGLKVRLLAQFNDRPRLAELYVEFYGKKQRENQPVAVFIADRWALGKRLLPEAEDGDLLATITNNITNSIKVHLIGREINNVEQLLQITTALERTLKDSKKTTFIPPRREEKNNISNPTTTTRPERKSPPTPCMHCGGQYGTVIVQINQLRADPP